MSNVNDLPQYAIDDIALEYNAEPPVLVTNQPLIVVGNTQQCVTPPLSAPVCIPANKYVVTVVASQRVEAQAFVNAKAQAELYAITHSKLVTRSILISFRGSPSGSVTQTPFNVTGLVGVTSKMTLFLSPLQEAQAGTFYLMLLLQSPTGQVAEMMWNCGDAGLASVGINLTIDDTGATMPTDGSNALANGGFYKPTSKDNTVSMTSPGPAAPYVLPLSTFNGVNPNGTWRLWGENRIGLAQDLSLPNGFSLQFTTV